MTHVIGYQFITAEGYPLGNVMPTLEAAEDIACFEEAGWFAELVRDELAHVYFMRRVYAKGETS